MSARETAVCLLALLTASASAGQQAGSSGSLAEELLVVESSILLQTAGKTRADNLEVVVDGSLGKALAVYPLTEVGLTTTLYFDLCGTSFSRLVRAVVMIAAVTEQLLEVGPVSLVLGAPDGRVLLGASRDRVALEAALASLLRLELGACQDPAPLAAIDRLRTALDRLPERSTAPSLLVAYGFDHASVSPEELTRYEPHFARAGEELAGGGRTTVVLLPTAESDTRLREEEVRSLVGLPEDPPRAIDLVKVLGWLFAPKRILPDDPRLYALAADPGNVLVRALIAPSRGRMFAFPQQLAVFSRALADFQILYYRCRQPEPGRPEEVAPIEVRSRRSGEPLPTARVASTGGPSTAARAGGNG